MFTVAGLVPGQGYSESSTEPSNPSNGDFWWDTANELLYQHVNGSFIRLAASLPPAWNGDRALIYRGRSPSANINYNDIDYYNITTSGNASDFGDTSAVQYNSASAGSKSRNLLFYGIEGSGNVATDRIDYVTVATTGNATDFGNQGYSNGSWVRAVSNGTKAFSIRSFGSGEIEVVTIDTTGNATQWSENDAALNVNQGYNQDGYDLNATSNDATRGIFRRGDGRMYYFNMDTYANVTEFSSSTDTLHEYTNGGASDGTYGILSGGRQSGTAINNISYITIQSPSNATDFGDLTIAREGCVTTGNGTYATINGGRSGTTGYNTIDYVTIATPGNAIDFGDLVTNIGNHLSGGSGSP